MKEFDTFSEAFRYGIDKKGIRPVDIYPKIAMDAGYFSNIYTGEVKNPQSPTRNKLLSVVDFDIVNEKGKWVIEFSDHSQNQANEPDSSWDMKGKASELNRQSKDGQVQEPLDQEDLIRQLEAAQSLIRLALDNLKKK